MLIVLMGPQGSGKGTQAEMLEEKGFKHISVGDTLKELMRTNHPQAETIQEYVERGDLLPPKIINDVVKDAVEETDKDVVLDGFPRNEANAEFLLNHWEADLAVELHVSDEEAVRRLSKRRVCTATHHTYNADNITQEDRAQCKAAGGKIIQREDDQPEAIKHRLEIYHEQTRPIIKTLQDAGIPCIKVDGEQSKNAVQNDLVKAIHDH